MFIPRHPVVENQFCQFAAQTSDATGIGGVLAYAGSVCYMDANATNQDAIVKVYANAAPGGDMNVPFGFLLQKVKTGYHSVHPSGFMMPGDLGSTDVVAQPSYTAAGVINGTKEAPVGVAHLGIYDTVHYTSSGAMSPGEQLGVASGVGNAGGKVTQYASRLTSIDTVVARVVKGASAAQVAANIANTTLFAIRIKLTL